jgi:hypothetical protein
VFIALQCWDIVAEGTNLQPASESQLRDRLKKSAIHLEALQRSFFKYFLQKDSVNKENADKIMIKTRGPFGIRNRRLKVPTFRIASFSLVNIQR